MITAHEARCIPPAALEQTFAQIEAVIIARTRAGATRLQYITEYDPNIERILKLNGFAVEYTPNKCKPDAVSENNRGVYDISWKDTALAGKW